MRSWLMFSSLMASGIVIVLFYIWSGESMVALVLAMMTFIIIVGLLQWKPWTGGADLATAGRRSEAPRILPESADGVAGDGGMDRAGAGDSPPCWRCEFNITWDERGISGVPLGSRAPQVWSWSQIDDIGREWCVVGEDPDSGNERLAVRLDFPSLRNPEEPDKAWVMYGRNQHPNRVERDARDAWRESKVTRSRFHDLTAEERTLKLADHLAPDGVEVSRSIRSPELLYQEIRRTLLGGGALCRLTAEVSFEDVLDTFDRLLEANDAGVITTDEEQELLSADGPDRIASLHCTLDWIAEQRGYRVAFIDSGDRADPTGGDYLIGLIPASSADDWDGQSVGSGLARVMLDRPV